MKLHCYCYYNRKGGFYTAPFFNQYDKEIMLQLLERSVATASKDEKTFLEECDFCYVGQFDDQSGLAVLNKPEFLRNFAEEKKEDNKDG